MFGKVDITSAFFVQKTLFYSAHMPQDANLQHPQPKRIKIDKQGDVEVNMEENVPHHLWSYYVTKVHQHN